MDFAGIAKRYTAAGLSIIPTNEIKEPATGGKPWKEFQSRIPGEAEIHKWTARAPHGMGIVCGKVSGGLEVLDLDLKNDASGKVWFEFKALVKEQAPGILQKLVIQETPSIPKEGETAHRKGYHLAYRCKTISGNLKLARSATPNGAQKNPVLIETRGEGGYFCASPTPGYTLLQGSFDSIPEITEEERGILLDCARAMNEEEKSADSHYAPPSIHGATSPCDDYDTRATTDEKIAPLLKFGWTIAFRRGEVLYLRRPGKKRGISATFNHIPNRLYVFSTSTPFESEKSYKPYAIIAVLEFEKEGDKKFIATTKALLERGFGVAHKQARAAESRQRASGPARPEIAATESKPRALASVDEGMKSLHEVIEKGFPKGELTGIASVDELMTVFKGILTIFTGYSYHGKSEVVDAIMIHLAKASGWHWYVFSPENYPLFNHLNKLVPKYLGKPLHGPGKASRQEVDAAGDFLKSRFSFFNGIDEDITLDTILADVEEALKTKRVDGVIIDPWNELEAARPDGMTETDYIGLSLKRIRMFARRHNLAIWIVAHPAKPKRDQKTGKLPVPSLYDISGSAHWFNKADNGVVVYRDDAEGYTKFITEKIKFRHHGKKGEAKLRYDFATGIFHPWEAQDAIAATLNAPRPSALPVGDADLSQDEDSEPIPF